MELRYAVTVLRRERGFTTAAVLALALGIGATTAVFSVTYGVLLRPLPYPEPERAYLSRTVRPLRADSYKARIADAVRRDSDKEIRAWRPSIAAVSMSAISPANGAS